MAKTKKRPSNDSNEAYYQAIRNRVKRELGLPVTEAEDRLAAKTSAGDQREYDPIREAYESAYREQLIKELANKKNLANGEKTDTAPDATLARTISIQNSNVLLGNVQQTENLQIGNDASVQKYSKAKMAGILGSIAAFLTILYRLGWLEVLKAFISKIWTR
jgi:hypothetical protein